MMSTPFTGEPKMVQVSMRSERPDTKDIVHAMLSIEHRQVPAFIYIYIYQYIHIAAQGAIYIRYSLCKARAAELSCAHPWPNLSLRSRPAASECAAVRRASTGHRRWASSWLAKTMFGSTRCPSKRGLYNCSVKTSCSKCQELQGATGSGFVAGAWS